MTDRVASAPAPERVGVFARLWEPGLGDLLQRNIYLALIRRAFPSAAITHVLPHGVAAAQAEFLGKHSYATEVIECPDYGDDRPDAWAMCLDRLRAADFDLCVVDPDSRGMGGEEAKQCGIERRVGFALGHTGPSGLTESIRIARPIFGTPDLYDFACGMARAFGVAAPGTAETVAPMPFVVEALPAARHPIVAVHPGGAPHWNRRWPLAKYVELAGRLSTLVGSLALIGSAEEAHELAAARLRMIEAGVADVRVEAGVSLNRLANVLARADLLVGGDSAPAHIAAALGRPTTVLYGPTSTEFMWTRVYPRHEGINLRYPCQQVRNLPRGPGTSTMPCVHACRYPYEGPYGPYPRCLSDISVDEVFRAVKGRLM